MTLARLVSFALCAAAAAGGLRAQSPPLAGVGDPPVRYDHDLLPPAFHQSRRDSVLAILSPDAFAVVFSAPRRNREADVDYEYRQSSDLYYLTGMQEPNAVLLLAPGGIVVGSDTVQEVLAVPPRDPAQETWTGRRLGPERAAAELGIAKAVPTDRLAALLERLAQDGRRLYHLPLPGGVADDSPLADQLRLVTDRFPLLAPAAGSREQHVASLLLATDSEDDYQRRRRAVERWTPDSVFADPALRELGRAYAAAGTLADWVAWRREHVDRRYADGITLRARLDGLRTVKTSEELALLRRAIEITAAAHREAIRSIEPGMYEYEVEALIEYVFHRNGAESPGFPSIVGSGENAVILHYETNRRQMQAGDLVVIDIGAEYHGYTADVTRTVPVSGRFSPEQRAIYDIVLRAQEAGIRAVRAGAPFGAADQAARAVVAQGLQQLGLLGRDGNVRRFFNHGTSHYLGLMVHDVGTGGPLAPGTVITVEPGVYIPPAPDVDRKWWHIGVRIEDDVLVTEGEPVVLSTGAPRAPEEIEALMREHGLGNAPAGRLPRPSP